MNQLLAAFVRTFITALGTAAASISTMVAAGNTTRTILWGALATFLAPFVTRFGIEGFYDKSRADTGKVLPSDVGAPRA
jgi:hypothetical protein